MKSDLTRLLGSVAICLLSVSLPTRECLAATSAQDYCSIPPFVAASLPPLVMLDVGRDHKLYYQAYNDAADLDGDGKLDIDYTHSIDYYGYFDSYKCYTYDDTAKQFNPAVTTTTKFCAIKQWSGNVLNWVTMSRMDVLKKVLYGGYRSTDTATSTILQRVYVPNDAHSWGKELTGKLCSNGTAYTTNCSVNADCDGGYTCQDIETSGKYLVPFTTATSPSTCIAVAPTSVTTGKVMVTRYSHSSSKRCGVANSAALIASYEPDKLFVAPTNLVTYVNGFEDASLDPSTDHFGSNYNILATTNFTPDVSGTWQFAVDGDDDVEVQVGPTGVVGGGTVVAQYLGCHGASGGQSHNGSISLTAGTKYTIVARHFEDGGGEGVRVWFKRPPTTSVITTSTDGTYNRSTMPCVGGTVTGGASSSPHTCGTGGDICTCTPNIPSDTTVSTSGASITVTPINWTDVTSSSATTLYATGIYAPLALEAPVIASGNECAVMATGFIADGIPQVGASVTFGESQRHLFCSTTAGSATPTDEPILRVLTNRPERIWSWSAKERPVCDNSLGTPTDYSVRVKVCDPSYPETNCKTYGSSRKPTGLLHKYGEGDGTKVCSKNLSKACTTAMSDSSDCATGEGLCIYKSPMFFGMMSGSYTNNTQGGVLRKNVASIQEEISPADGTFTGTAGIMSSFDKFRIATFSNGVYSCEWVENGPINNGQCNDWGNPMGEILYETLRYFAGKGTANPDYTYGTDAALIDNSLGLPKPAWGFTKDSVTYQPYDIYPSCLRPFTLILSDINSSYDSDMIPGSAFNTTYAEDAHAPQLNIGNAPSADSALSAYNATSLLRAITNLIGTTEKMNNKDWFVGQSSGTNNDNICTAKTITDLSLVKGLCPEEPTKQGSYYLPALAYYGKTQLNANTGIPNMETFAVALASPVADLKIKVGGNFVTIAPTAKSVSGCLGVYENCANKLTFPAYDVTGTSPSFSGKGLVIPVSSTAFCPTNQIVNFFVDDIRYVGTDVVYANFRINYEDTEQGADHDMDAIVKYEVCTATARTNNYGTCGDSSTTPALAPEQFQIKLNSEYAAGCIDQVIGFTLSGTGSTTTDGAYLLIKDADVGGADGDTPDIVANMPTYASRVFTAAGTASGFLKNPLWYAAKWGGFTDGNSNKIPDDLSEWAKNDGVNPDNYFLVVNPLKLETQLDAALNGILAKAASGTAAAVANNRSGERGANVVQALLYPQWSNNGDVKWLGDVQALWFYLDPLVKFSGIYEDTDGNKELNLAIDLPPGPDPKTVKALWKAGELLHARTAESRTIYTLLDQSSDLTKPVNTLVTDNRSNLKSLLGIGGYSDAQADTLINYIRGVDVAGYRSRTVTIPGVTNNATTGVGVWKLGDIIYSTPQIQGADPLNNYVGDYGDLSYYQYSHSSDYKTNNFVYTGSNDGMLHAFRLGQVQKITDTTNPYRIASIVDSTNLGKEEWAFVPTNVLPFIKNCAESGYCHQYLVDGNPVLFDAAINKPTGCSESYYWNCGRKTTYSSGTTLNTAGTSWKSVLIGSMGLGGATRNGNCNETLNKDSDPANNLDCIKTPNTGTVLLPVTDKGFSSYFALDISSPTTPQFMWEFSDASIDADASLSAAEKEATKGLGLTTPESAIVRINTPSGNHNNNGRWFAILASGPTGTINTATRQFLGRSDQNLKIYVVDINPFNNSVTTFKKCTTAGATGCNYWVFDTGKKFAFASSLLNSTFDIDKGDAASSGFYSDDVVYVTYTKASLATTGSQSGFPVAWDKGGVVRLITNNDPDPAKWFVSTLVDDIGPATRAVDILINKNTRKLWVYFGEGRYFYSGDDLSTRRKIYGIADPCFSYDLSHINKLSSEVAYCPAVTLDQLKDQTSTPSAPLGITDKGWYINMYPATTTSGAERLTGGVSANTNGVVFFTTLVPSSDICSSGGYPSGWAVNGSTGGTPPAASMNGKIIITTSDQPTAKPVNIGSLFTDEGGRKMSQAASRSLKGIPPPKPLPSILPPGPSKRIVNIQEK